MEIRTNNRSFRCLLAALTAGVFISAATVHRATAEDLTPKVLYLIIEDDRLIASNIHLSLFDELRLGADETVLKKKVAEAVAVVVTNKRIIGYGAFIGSWRPIRYLAGEKVKGLEAEDFSALVTTSKRFLNFNGRNGLWAETLR